MVPERRRARSGLYDGLRDAPAALAALRFAIALGATLPASLCLGATLPAIGAALLADSRALGSRSPPSLVSATSPARCCWCRPSGRP